MADWKKRFLELTTVIASWSKDKSIGTAAIIATKDNRIVSFGYNGFPSGCNDDWGPRHERPLKYSWTEHAERNAIYNAARNGVSTLGCIMYLKWFPCSPCARAIIQSGIDTIYCSEPDFDAPKYGEDFKVAIEMLIEAGVKVRFVEGDEIKRSI